VWVGNVDPAGTIAQLAEADADILLLQEVDGTVAPLLKRLRARYPFGSLCRPRCSAAIFSRWPTERVRYRFRDGRGRPFGPALVQTRIRVPGVPTPMPIVSLHLSRRADAGQLARDSNTLVVAVARQQSPATVVAGDFNLPGWAPSMRRLETGLFPLVRATRGRATFPARLAGMPWPVPMMAIDHLFAGPGWAVSRTLVMPANGSDHRPIQVELVWQR
jgi:vancomycin resistance protein VanJ